MSQFHTLTVYLGSSGRARPVFKEAAEKLGALIGAHGKHLIYGGMDAGLMGILANGALDAGAQVTGIIPKKLQDSERIHPGLGETILVGDLWERKRKMFMDADVVVGLPGGFGTVDESLEVLYWGYLGLHSKPLALVNIEGYWDPLIDYFEKLPDFEPRYLIVAETVEHLFDELESWDAPDIQGADNDLPHFEDEILCDTDEPIIIREATIEQTYLVISALGLKQLDKHNRHMGLLNDKGQFDHLIKWIKQAEKEHFITEKCLKLFSVDSDENALKKKLDAQKHIHINLHEEKWGPSETKTHLEIHEEG